MKSEFCYCQLISELIWELDYYFYIFERIVELIGDFDTNCSDTSEIMIHLIGEFDTNFDISEIIMIELIEEFGVLCSLSITCVAEMIF